MHSAFNLFVFHNSMFTSLLLFFLIYFFNERAMSSPEKLHLRITIIIIIITIALNPTSIFQSLSFLPYTGLLGTLLTFTAHHLLLNFPVFQSFHLLKMQTSSVTFCELH